MTDEDRYESYGDDATPSDFGNPEDYGRYRDYLSEKANRVRQVITSAILKAVVARERERCAKLADTVNSHTAELIRNGSEL